MEILLNFGFPDQVIGQPHWDRISLRTIQILEKKEIHFDRTGSEQPESGFPGDDRCAKGSLCLKALQKDTGTQADRIKLPV
jgi:hypothetical protein